MANRMRPMKPIEENTSANMGLTGGVFGIMAMFNHELIVQRHCGLIVTACHLSNFDDTIFQN